MQGGLLPIKYWNCCAFEQECAQDDNGDPYCKDITISTATPTLTAALQSPEATFETTSPSYDFSVSSSYSVPNEPYVGEYNGIFSSNDSAS